MVRQNDQVEQLAADDSPYRGTVSRVCSNAWFAMPLVCCRTSGLSDEQTQFRVE